MLYYDDIKKGSMEMIILNENKENLVAQKDYLVNHHLLKFQKTMDRLEDLETILTFIEVLERKDISFSDALKLLVVHYLCSRKESRIHEEMLQRLKENQQNYQNFFQSCFDLLKDDFEQVKNNLCYPCSGFFSNNLPYDATDILYSFFREEDLALKDIFEEIYQKGNIYHIPQLNNDKSRIDTILGRYCYNRVQGIHNIFLKDEITNLCSLSTLVHELGHAKETVDQQNLGYDYTSVFPSFYIEVTSQFYQEKFLEFLVGNDVFCNSADFKLFEVYNRFMINCENISNIPYSEDQTIMRNIITDLTYGCSFALLTADFPISSTQLHSLHDKYSPPSQLADFEVTPEIVASNMKKKWKTYFKI